MSFLVDTKIRMNKKKYKIYFNDFISLIKKEFFKKYKLNKLFSETFSFRKDHIKILEKNNFQKEGFLRQNIYKKKYFNSYIHSVLKKDFLKEKSYK